MPSTKDSYEERNGWGEISGYLKRAALPAGTPVADAPAENPSRPMSREDHRRMAARQGRRGHREQRRLTDRARPGALKAGVMPGFMPASTSLELRESALIKAIVTPHPRAAHGGRFQRRFPVRPARCRADYCR